MLTNKYESVIKKDLTSPERKYFILGHIPGGRRGRTEGGRRAGIGRPPGAAGDHPFLVHTGCRLEAGNTPALYVHGTPVSSEPLQNSFQNK